MLFFIEFFYHFDCMFGIEIVESSTKLHKDNIAIILFMNVVNELHFLVEFVIPKNTHICFSICNILEEDKEGNYRSYKNTVYRFFHY